MEAFLFAILLVVLVIRWIYLRDRIAALEGRLTVLERASINRAPSWNSPSHRAAPESARPAPPPPPSDAAFPARRRGPHAHHPADPSASRPGPRASHQ